MINVEIKPSLSTLLCFPSGLWNIAHLTFTCSKSTIETLEKGLSMFKVTNKNTRTTLTSLTLLLTLHLFQMFLLLTLNK